MITKTLELFEQERIARYLNREHVKPTFVARNNLKTIHFDGFNDIFLYDEKTQRGFLPINGYQFPIGAILNVHGTIAETLLDINFRMAIKI